VLYLVFNEGYLATAGNSVTRGEISAEAIRLGRLLVELLPEPEALGLLALMLLHESRRSARANSDGDLILLENQDRGRWDSELIAEGSRLVASALSSGRFGAYTVQAAIASVHANAATPQETDWPQIVSLYDLLVRLEPTPIVELNRAVAVAMRDGPSEGLVLIEGILARGSLTEYYLAHSARGEMLRRLGRTAESRGAYERALSLAKQEPERRFLRERIAELRSSPS
jgi:RNA polymerase sigma-70 factor (ECF subfamily)